MSGKVSAACTQSPVVRKRLKSFSIRAATGGLTPLRSNSRALRLIGVFTHARLSQEESWIRDRGVPGAAKQGLLGVISGRSQQSNTVALLGPPSFEHSDHMRGLRSQPRGFCLACELLHECNCSSRSMNFQNTQRYRRLLPP